METCRGPLAKRKNVYDTNMGWNRSKTITGLAFGGGLHVQSLTAPVPKLYPNEQAFGKSYSLNQLEGVSEQSSLAH
jgi:hypothetical protein